MQKIKTKLAELSPHLFWDTEVSTLDWEEHAEYIFERVLFYGQVQDWLLIKKVYGTEGIKNLAQNSKTLDDRSLSFLSFILNIRKESFKCYKHKQSQQNFWTY